MSFKFGNDVAVEGVVLDDAVIEVGDYAAFGYDCEAVVVFLAFGYLCAEGLQLVALLCGER